MPDARSRLHIGVIGIMILLCAFWGVNQVAIKVANSGISPVLQAGLRSCGAAALVWGWMAFRGMPLFNRDRSLGLGVLVGLLFAAEFVVLYWGLVFTTASRAVLFLYTAPFTVAIGAHFFVPGERLSVVKSIGLIAAFIGMLIAFGDGLRYPSHRELLGDSLTLLAGVLWGVTTVMVKATRLIRLRPAKVLFYQLGVSALVLPPVSLALGESGITQPTLLVIGCLLYQTVLIAFITYLVWFWLISRYPASTLSAFTFLAPIFGLLAGAYLLSEQVSVSLVVAMALVAAGILLVNRAQPADLAVTVPVAEQESAQA